MYLASPLTADDILSYGIPNVALATGARWRRDGIGLTRQRPLPGLEEADEGARLFTHHDFLGGGAGLDRLPAVPDVVYDERYLMGGVLAEVVAKAAQRLTMVTPATPVTSWPPNSPDPPFCTLAAGHH